MDLSLISIRSEKKYEGYKDDCFVYDIGRMLVGADVFGANAGFYPPHSSNGRNAATGA